MPNTEYENALKSALNILNYADNTEKKLREKLRSRGYSRSAVDEAVVYLKRYRYLDDRRFMERAVNHYANVKLYGARRIISSLYAKGFAREDIESLDFDEYGIDFVELCRKRIEKTASRYKSREALVAALLRYGFSYSEIKEATTDK
ncbi:MAG: regulatory protein RecX [Clostridia bacterium]|nr:regulatory protein RecX [Clostridia bacterium]